MADSGVPGPWRLLHPRCVTLDHPAEAYLHDRRRHHGRPWITLLMVTSLDGAIHLDHSSRGLGGPADQLVYRHVRSLADTVLVGAETVRIEVYRPLPPSQTLAVVSRSGDLGPHGPGLLAAANTLVVAGEPHEIAARLPGDMCCLEGGPAVNSAFLAAGLVDECCISIAPRLVGGGSPRLASGPPADPHPWTLASVLEADGFLFCRYLRQPAS
jgi:5-amino-6-(5-phosphoribosylamino)uracil reductase